MTYEIEIPDLPDGWKPVAFRVAKAGDNYWDEVEGLVRKATCDMEYKYVIMEKKRWRAERGDYWTLAFSEDFSGLVPFTTCDITSDVDNARHISGNYFQTEEQAQAVADEFNRLLMEAHK